MARKREDEDHENADRWMVSYADFLTLLFAFFTTMYALSSVNENKYRAVSESLTTAFNQPRAGAEAPIIGGTTPEDLVTIAFKKTFSRDFRSVQTALRGLEKDNKVSISMEKRGVVVSLSERIVFESGNADIMPQAKAIIGDIAVVLRGMPNHVRIEGHTDNVPISTPRFPSNWELSSARALSILKHLVDVHGLNPGKLSATGYGEFRPFAPNLTADGRAKNRRVDIVILNRDGSFDEPG
ncbi:MAG: OmpA family protein [Deltaproteobacteria bacterium]|nr:OmpA family protein [Deltaproteobacteria bacterium]